MGGEKKRSCGDCAFFVELKTSGGATFANWGECSAPVPAHVFDHCGSIQVWRNGGSGDYGEDCDVFKDLEVES